MNKVVIVGCGNVGMSYAYALVTKGANIDSLVLIDINKTKAEGEALDLNHALPFAPRSFKIKAGNYSDCNNASLVVICAGRNQEIGESRNALLGKNIEVFKSIINEINKTKFDGIYLVATNPLDVMTLVTQKLSGFPHNRVLGTGTTLDTSRLRHLIAEQIDVSPKNIHAYVVGEHGDSEVVAWDCALIGMQQAKQFLTKAQMDKISEDVRLSAETVISKKGNTSYGIGMCLLKITNSIFSNENNILTISAYDKKHDIYWSRPSVVGTKGVSQTIELTLSASAQKQLDASIKTIKELKKSFVL